jgi:hypothetical protein
MLNRESLNRAALNASQATTCLIELGAGTETVNRARTLKKARECEPLLQRAIMELRAFTLGFERRPK